MEARRCVLLKHGEMFLKGENHSVFARVLEENLRAGLPEECGRVRTWPRRGITVLYPQRAAEVLAARMSEVFGINTVQLALRVPRTVDGAVTGALTELRRRHAARERAARPSFAVEVRRRDKRFPVTSMELAAHVGAEVQRATGWPVDLDHPEVRVTIEVDHHEAFVSADRRRGAGGLPTGSSGRAVALLSGGHDSPVAAHRAMRRGLRCDYVHFTGAPYTGPASTYKAYALVRQLSRHQPEARLWVVPLGRAQRTLATASAEGLRTIAQRRLMVRIGAAVAAQVGAEALVTGDSLGQVSSQTLSNLATVDEASDLPLVRPLMGWDKEEIVAEARRIGTEEISRMPDEDCCTLLAPHRPATRSHPDGLAWTERRADPAELVEQALAQAQEFRFGGSGEDARAGRLVG